MGKAGRRPKGNTREIKSAKVTASITQSQRDKLDWLSVKLQKSIADLIGSWIERVFDAAGGDLSVPAEELESRQEKLLLFLDRCQHERVGDFEIVELAQELNCDERMLKQLRDCLQSKERGKNGVDQR